MKKRLLCMLGAAVMMTAAVPTVFAAEAPQNSVCQSDSGESGIAPHADVIVLKTRKYNGKQQYRHWNQTKGCWVEPDWIDVP